MPVSELYGRPPKFLKPHGEPSFFDRYFSDFRATSPAKGPAEVIAAVEAMDDGQRARLGGLLGVLARHPLLYLPGPSGAFSPPLACRIDFNAARDPAPLRK